MKKLQVRFENCVDKEARNTSKTGTPPKTSITNDCEFGGGEDKQSIGTNKEHNTNARGNNNAEIRGTNKQSCTDEKKRKGTERKVPQFGQGGAGSANYLGGLG